MNISILQSAINDLHADRIFYESRAQGIGTYFLSHHRTYGSVYGGFLNTTYSDKEYRALRQDQVHQRISWEKRSSCVVRRSSTDRAG